MKKTLDDVLGKLEEVHIPHAYSIYLRDYYTKAYPSDSLGQEIRENATFGGLWGTLCMGQDVYGYINVNDSVVRERLFSRLAEILGVNYDVVYGAWLAGA